MKAVDQSPGELTRAWEILNNSPVKAALHNELVKKIEAMRSELETPATHAELIRLQMEIKAHRFLFNLIHRNDGLTKK